MDNHKDKQEHSLVENQTANLSRRQIIRGMAAVPVVMTLSNAHAQAVASNLRCVAPGAPRPADPGCTPTQPIRDLASAPEYSGNLSGYYDDGDASVVYEFDGQNNQYCPVYVNSDGIITDVNGGDPITASCFNSFA